MNIYISENCVLYDNYVFIYDNEFEVFLIIDLYWGDEFVSNYWIDRYNDYYSS